MKFIIFLILLSWPALALPQPVGYVNDFANILPDASQIEQLLSEYEKNTTIEIAVVTITELPEDHTAATYAVELFNEWGIGKKSEDNGILVLIVENGEVGNRMRIELGYGMQGYITGAEAGRILDEALPSYESGYYQDAVIVILQGLDKQLEFYSTTNASRQSDLNILSDFVLPNLPLIIFLLFLFASFALSSRCPYCLKGIIKCSGNYCVCRHCGRKFTRRKRYVPFIPTGGFGRSSSGGFGGFGGGSSGGGGAGR